MKDTAVAPKARTISAKGFSQVGWFIIIMSLPQKVCPTSSPEFSRAIGFVSSCMEFAVEIDLDDA